MAKKIKVQTQIERLSILDLLYLPFLCLNYILGLYTTLRTGTSSGIVISSLIIELLLFIEFIILLVNIQRHKIKFSYISMILYSLNFVPTIVSIIVQLYNKQSFNYILKYNFSGCSWFRALLPCNFFSYENYLHTQYRKNQFQQKTLNSFLNNIRWSTEVIKLIIKMLYTPLCFVLMFVNIFIVTFYLQDNNEVGFIDSLYFVIVTISTVGYGDMTVHSLGGKTVVCIFIILAIVYIPTSIQACLSKWKEEWPVIKIGYKVNNAICVVGHQDMSLCLVLRKIIPEYINLIFLNIFSDKLQQQDFLRKVQFMPNVFVEYIDTVSYEALIKYNIRRASFVLTHSLQTSDNETIMSALLIAKYLQNGAALMIYLQSQNVLNSTQQLLSPFISPTMYSISSRCELNAQILANSIMHKGFYVFFVNILSKRNLFTDILFQEQDQETHIQQYYRQQIKNTDRSSLLIENTASYDLSITKKLIEQSVNIQLIRKDHLEEKMINYGDLGLRSNYYILYTKPDENDIFYRPSSVQLGDEFNFISEAENFQFQETGTKQYRNAQKLAFLILEQQYDYLIERTKEILCECEFTQICEFHFNFSNSDENRKNLCLNNKIFKELKDFDQIIIISQNQQHEFYIIVELLRQHGIQNIITFSDILTSNMFSDRLGLSLEFLRGNFICVPSRILAAESIYNFENFENVVSFLEEIGNNDMNFNVQNLNKIDLFTYRVLKETTLKNVLNYVEKRNQRILYFTKQQTVVSYTPALDQEVLYIEKDDFITVCDCGV